MSYTAVPTGAAYWWQERAGLTLEEWRDVLEERREQLLDAVQHEEDGLTDQLRDEWCELLAERDRLLRLQLKQENEQKLQCHMATLLQLLVVIGQFDHSSTPRAMKAALFNLYTQLSDSSITTETVLPRTSKYNIPVPPTLPATDGTAKVRDDPNDRPKDDDFTCTPDSGIARSLEGESTLCSTLDRHGLPNISRLTLSASTPKRVKFDDVDLEESLLLLCEPSQSRRRKTSTSRSPLTLLATPRNLRAQTALGSKYSLHRSQRRTPHRTPRMEDLRRCILTGKDNLKSTPGVKRSPGGTPERAFKPVFASDNPSDIICLALQKKFFNVRRLYGSPLKDDDKHDSREASFNLSID